MVRGAASASPRARSMASRTPKHMPRCSARMIFILLIGRASSSPSSLSRCLLYITKHSPVSAAGSVAFSGPGKAGLSHPGHEPPSPIHVGLIAAAKAGQQLLFFSLCSNDQETYEHATGHE